jgi:predicted membrane-bound spermidine synthase
MRNRVVGAIIAGIVAVIFAVIATLIVDALLPTSNLTWALIAVGFASFFAGLAGYLSGQDRSQLPT